MHWHWMRTLKGRMMRVGVTFYGSARVVIDRPRLEVLLASAAATPGQVAQQLVVTYPCARPPAG
jgi:hypothetical protein